MSDKIRILKELNSCFQKNKSIQLSDRTKIKSLIKHAIVDCGIYPKGVPNLCALRIMVLKYLPKEPESLAFLKTFNDHCYERHFCVKQWKNPAGQLHNDTFGDDNLLKPAYIIRDSKFWYLNGRKCSAGFNAKGEIMPCMQKRERSYYKIYGLKILLFHEHRGFYRLFINDHINRWVASGVSVVNIEIENYPPRIIKISNGYTIQINIENSDTN